jgi:hypothetical protein
VRWFLDLGVRPDVAPYLGRTGTRWHDPVTQQLHDLIESRSR